MNYEADQAVGLGVRGKVERLAELAQRVVVIASRVAAFASRDDQLALLDLVLDVRGRVVRAPGGETKLLEHVLVERLEVGALRVVHPDDVFRDRAILGLMRKKKYKHEE